MSQITHYYLFTPAQLEAALEAHFAPVENEGIYARERAEEAKVRIREFLDSPAAVGQRMRIVAKPMVPKS